MNTGPSEYELELRQWKKEVAQLEAANEDKIAAFSQGIADQLNGYGGNLCAEQPTCSAPDLNLDELPERPEAPNGGDQDQQGPDPVYIRTISAEQAAYIAISTSLTVPRVEPEIGPEPHNNQWGMAVVGYPYWLWVDGPTHVGPVSDSSAGLAVSLEAHLSTVVFDMGDGTKINCDGPGTRYTSQVEVREESPTCGHVYQKMSRHQPGGKYTVTATAYWDVAYTTPIGSGTIPIATSSSREIVVGELQVVIES